MRGAGPWLAAAVLVASVGACSSGDDDSATTPTTTLRTSTTFPADLLDACDVLPASVIEDVLGRAVTSERTVAVGGGSTCDHRPADAPDEWTISVFVFEHDTEGNDIDAHDAFVRFRAEAGELDDVDGVGDEAFADTTRVGVRAGGVYLDVTAIRFDGGGDVLLELARRAVAALDR